MTHQLISFIKSGFRILGYLCLLFNIELGVFWLVISEGVGILEEIGQ